MADKKHANEKMMNARHGHGGIRGKNAVEKAIQTTTRQAGKKEIRDQQEE
jgi:hypothetical protein